MLRGITFLSALVTGLLLLGPIQGDSAVSAAPAGPAISSVKTQTDLSARSDVQSVGYYGGGGYYSSGYHGWYGHRHRGHYRYGWPGYFYSRPYYRPYYNPYPRYDGYGGGRNCGYWRSRCAENWGYGGSDYYGCLRYEGCY